jgi:hypothetical protein
MSENLYSVEEIAAQMGKSARWVRKLCLTGKINAVKVANSWIILERWKK